MTTNSLMSGNINSNNDEGSSSSTTKTKEMSSGSSSNRSVDSSFLGVLNDGDFVEIASVKDNNDNKPQENDNDINQAALAMQYSAQPPITQEYFAPPSSAAMTSQLPASVVSMSSTIASGDNQYISTITANNGDATSIRSDNKSKSSSHISSAIGIAAASAASITSKMKNSFISNTNNNINETMELSDDDLEAGGDRTPPRQVEKAIPIATPPSSPSRSKAHRKKELSGGAASTAGSISPRGRRDNFRRNVILAVSISIVLIALVGVGLGISTRKGDDSSKVSSATSETTIIGVVLIPDEETDTPTLTPTISVQPSTTPPSLSPSKSPSRKPSVSPSEVPTSSPVTPSPTLSPSTPPTLTHSPTVDFTPGDLAVTHTELDIRMSSGLSVKEIAQTGQSPLPGGTQSFHAMMDGAGIVKLPDGGYVYVSNSEISGTGGVYGLYFNADGEITDYKTLLANTSRNCGGGLTPWNTWISCEETSNGQCWQVDPNKDSLFHNSPQETLLGGDGGKYETVTVDNSNPNNPVFFTTEDSSDGALRRFIADGNGWDSLHKGGVTTFLRIIDSTRFEWTRDEAAARASAELYYGNAEGIIYHEGLLYFAAKKIRTLLILDLENMTYETEITGAQLEGKGTFNAQPDQIVFENYKRWIYFSEDGGSAPGVYVRDFEGTYRTVFEGISGGRYDGDETVGIALSPNRMKLYAGFQDAGVLMEFTRDDGLAFE